MARKKQSNVVPYEWPFTKERFEEVLSNSFGNCKSIALQLGCSIDEVRSYIAQEKLENRVLNERNRLLFMAEFALAEKISKGDTSSILFVLKTLGREDGWTEKDATSSLKLFDPENTVINVPDRETKELLEKIIKG